MAVKPAGTLHTEIGENLANNNSGDITAEDVRESIRDVLDSIPYIVAHANFNTTNAFQGNVRAELVGGAEGLFIAESGVQFPSLGAGDAANNFNIQTVPYPGNENVDHNLLANLANGDEHTQYLNVNGQREMAGNLGLGSYWVNSEGNDGNNTSSNKGLRFQPDPDDGTVEVVHVGSQSSVTFDADGSEVDSAKGIAKAWVNFSSTGGVITYRASYNIQSITYISPGQYTVQFKNPIPVPYVAIGMSNARSNIGNEPYDKTNFDLNSVGVVDRNENYVSFCVINSTSGQANAFVDAEINDLVIFGLSNDNETPDTVTTQPPA